MVTAYYTSFWCIVKRVSLNSEFAGQDDKDMLLFHVPYLGIVYLKICLLILRKNHEKEAEKEAIN